MRELKNETSSSNGELIAEILRLRELVEDAYHTGHTDGYGDYSDYLCKKSLKRLMAEAEGPVTPVA